MSDPKWEVGPVKLVGGLEAYLDYFCESRQIWIGRFKNDKGQWYGADWTVEGRHENLAPTMHLVPPPKEKVWVQLWINVYSEGWEVWNNRELADSRCRKPRFACIEIEREVEEGEGLS